ncbi:MAG: hypothetical protein IJR25_03230 [Bacteroidales bacterium]|nr:hypothetical protein [Bacteroidales bacterium]
MESSLFIFLFWLIITVIVVIAKAARKASAHPSPAVGKTALDDILQFASEPDVAPAPEANQQPFAEGERATEVAEAAETAEAKEEAAPAKTPKAAGKDSGMEIDPVKLVVYSEIMSPGYEKY